MDLEWQCEIAKGQGMVWLIGEGRMALLKPQTNS